MSYQASQSTVGSIWRKPEKASHTYSSSIGDCTVTGRQHSACSTSLWVSPVSDVSRRSPPISTFALPFFLCTDVKGLTLSPAEHCTDGQTQDDSDVTTDRENSHTFAVVEAKEVVKVPPPAGDCPICMDTLTTPQTLPCTHQFCKDCLDQVVSTSKSHLCPTCRVPFRAAEGKQPKGGTMTTTTSAMSLPGYEGYGCITIRYDIPSGIQGPEHPNPGVPFGADCRVAYLPNNPKGQKTERLLRKAFNHRLTFNVGRSMTSGRHNCIVWNDIHHKTSPSHGPYGYPDPGYIDRVLDDLRARGISE